MAAQSAKARLRLVSSRADTTTPATEQPAEREIIIGVHPDEWVQYEGTAAQLQAEGLIPEGFEWPLAATIKDWKAEGFDYWLRRKRPEGHKGPMRSWLELDNWFIRIKVSGRDWHWAQRRAIERKAEALRDEIYHLSPAGQREWDANWRRYWAARADKAFQAFKAISVPERKKPGRKPKSEAGAQQ